MIQLIPATDIIGGRCVRLTQGDYAQNRTYDVTPLDMARQFEALGLTRLHLVDLDGAKAAQPCNLSILRDIASSTSLTIEWGGGIKTTEALHDVFDAGAHCAIIGSIAVHKPALMKEWLRTFGSERIILGADVRNGLVAVNGWQESSTATIDDLIQAFRPDGLQQAIVTDISRDGMLQGPNDELYVQLQQNYPDITFTVSGGISCAADIIRLDAKGLQRVIIGKAIYEGRISLAELSNLRTLEPQPQAALSRGEATLNS